MDQTLRERENSVLMHRVFQHDLYLLRLNTARAFIGALNTSANPVSDDVQEPIKLSAQVRTYYCLNKGVCIESKRFQISDTRAWTSVSPPHRPVQYISRKAFSRLDDYLLLRWQTLHVSCIRIAAWLKFAVVSGKCITFRNPEECDPGANVSARIGVRFRNARRVHLRLGNLRSATRVRRQAKFAEAATVRHHKHARRGARLKRYFGCHYGNIILYL